MGKIKYLLNDLYYSIYWKFKKRKLHKNIKIIDKNFLKYKLTSSFVSKIDLNKLWKSYLAGVEPENKK